MFTNALAFKSVHNLIIIYWWENKLFKIALKYFLKISRTSIIFPIFKLLILFKIFLFKGFLIINKINWFWLLLSKN